VSDGRDLREETALTDGNDRGALVWETFVRTPPYLWQKRKCI